MADNSGVEVGDWLKDNGAPEVAKTDPQESAQDLENENLDAEMQVAADHEAHQTGGQNRKCLIYGLILLVIVGIAVGVGVAVGGSGSSESTKSVQAPSPAEAAPTTPGPTPSSANDVREIIVNAARQGGDEFDDEDSYQSRALTWVLTQDVPAAGVQGSMDEQALQLYGLACIYYSTYATRNTWTDFHFGADGALPGWFSNRGWIGSSSEVCTNWHGITCNGNDQVEKIELDTNGLTGSLPPEIAYMAGSLKYLDLYNNLIHNKGDEGNSFLGELVNLEYLFFGTTSFEYDGIPTELGLLSNLKELDFSYSLYFGALPSGMWSKLTNLNYIVMDGNAYNSTFPQDLVELPNLEYVYAGFSFLKGTLEFLPQMPKIFELWVDDNPGIGGSIPTGISEVETLVSLSVTNCDLTGMIPTELGQMTDMIQMWLYDNMLTGTIPTELGDLKKLKVFQAQKNRLTGEMPTSMCSRRTPFGRLEELEADCDTSITCDGDCCTCCGAQCIAP